VRADRKSRTVPRSAADRLPVLRADPFRLRGFEAGDKAMVVEAGADPVIPLIATVPAGAGPLQAAAFVERQRHRLGDGFGYSFVIAESATDRGLGSIGLWLRDIDQGRASIGYWVVPSARGRGAARLALRALSAWALGDLAVPRLELHVEPWNTASLRTAEGAGYVQEGLLRSWQTVDGRRRDVYVYSRLPGDAT
jgi:[ribosomal protein S5]-alanine N-acetyltransferase